MSDQSSSEVRIAREFCGGTPEQVGRTAEQAVLSLFLRDALK
jgi:hypothetical protein